MKNTGIRRPDWKHIFSPLEETVSSVSYTHLDVYKRQAEEYNDKIMLMAGITAVACGAVILLLIGVIKLFLKMRKENDDFFY